MKREVNHEMDKLETEDIWFSFLNRLTPTGVETESEHFRDTPQRVSKMWKELLRGQGLSAESFSSILFPYFETKNNEMIIVQDIGSFGVCPHHLLPIEYISHVGYIPEHKAIGLSKIPRLVKTMSARLIIQEDLSMEICNVIQETLKPKGVMVVMRGIHGCTKFRGIRDENSLMSTSAITGVFRDPEEKAREEFLNIVSLNRSR